MTAVFYVSPSVVPSRAANSVHVVHQCAAFAQMGAQVTLVAKRAVPDAGELARAVAAAYGVNAETFRIESYYSQLSRGDHLRIAWHAIARMPTTPHRPEIIFTRNLYAAFWFGVLRRWPIFYECHEVELGRRGMLQSTIIRLGNVHTVLISQKLAEALAQRHGVRPAEYTVLPDAAPSATDPLPKEQRNDILAGLNLAFSLTGWRAICGYFGHLYQGRGIDMIQAMAEARLDVAFLVFGGNDADIERMRQANTARNVHFAGFVNHATARMAMSGCDILLMPYQRSVSIGVGQRDTAQVMSPMKMFEYLASGSPVISSDLPVLREVLQHEVNALLTRPDSVDEWLSHIDRLIGDPTLAQRLGLTGAQMCRETHSWTGRARRIMELAANTAVVA